MRGHFLQAVVGRVFATASAFVCGVISLKVYSHYLTPEIYGVILVALQVVGYLPLLDGGFRTAVNRRLLGQHTSESRSKLIGFCQVFYSLLGLVVIVAALISMLGYAQTPNARHSGQPLVFFLALGLVGALTVMAWIQMGLLVGLQDQSSLFVINGLNAWLTLGSLCLSLHAGATVWAFPISSLAGLCGVYPLGVLRIRKRAPSTRLLGFRVDDQFRECFSQLKAEAWACFRSQITTLILFSVDVVIVGLTCGARETAIYGVLSRFFGVIRSIVQATGEAAWPLVATEGVTNRELSKFLVRTNAWLYGGVAGAAVATLRPFIEWFMGAAWSPPTAILVLIAGRFVISGLASSVTYILYGLGEFAMITRYLERELIAAFALSILLKPLLGMNGIAGAFLLSTACGTLFPIYLAYARRVDQGLRPFLVQLWWRSLTGIACSWVTAELCLRCFPHRFGAALAGLTGFWSATMLGFLVSVVRSTGLSAKALDKHRLYQCLKQM